MVFFFPQVLNQWHQKASFSSVPVLKTGTWRNLVTVFLQLIIPKTDYNCEMFVFSIVPSSHKTEKGLLWHISTTGLAKCGWSTPVTMHIVFVWADRKALVIQLSGNMVEVRWVQWSATKKDRLCSATKLAKTTSARVIESSIGDCWKRNLKLWLLSLALTMSSCFVVARCFFTL